MTIKGYPRLAAYPVLAAVAFILDSPPVSINRTYGTRAFMRGEKASAMMYMTADAEERKQMIASGARMAIAAVDAWPRNPWIPTHVRMSIYAFNSKGDAGNEVKLAADAVEGLLYANDRVVSIGEIPKPVNDGTRGPRVEYVFELLEVRSEREAVVAEHDHLIARVHRLSRKTTARAIGHAAIELVEAKALLADCQARVRAVLGRNP